MGKDEKQNVSGLARFKTAAVLALLAGLLLLGSGQVDSFAAQMALYAISADLAVLSVYDIFKSL